MKKDQNLLKYGTFDIKKKNDFDFKERSTGYQRNYKFDGILMIFLPKSLTCLFVGDFNCMDFFA